MINELEEAVYDINNLMAVVIIGGYVGSSKDEIIMKGQHLYLRKLKDGFHVQEFLIL